jgi:hypothetical protein
MVLFRGDFRKKGDGIPLHHLWKVAQQLQEENGEVMRVCHVVQPAGCSTRQYKCRTRAQAHRRDGPGHSAAEQTLLHHSWRASTESAAAHPPSELPQYELRQRRLLPLCIAQLHQLLQQQVRHIRLQRKKESKSEGWRRNK